MTRLAFVDLDGTYVRSNSFHRWLKYLAFSPETPLSPLGRGVVLAHTGLRAARLISHARLKAAVLGQVAQLPQARQAISAAAYANALADDIAEPVRQLVVQLRSAGARTVLATAAPGNYAHAFAKAQGFDDCLATAETIGPDWHELLGPHKAAACRDYAARLGIAAEDIIAFTDHRDDLPLIGQSGLTIWCGPADQLPSIQSSTSARVIGLPAAAAVGERGLLAKGTVG
ncbi:HAD family hydrolase [Devosia aquimaris]|uniref:HAD family hydrolase n=1 Tax=Devosia aquimaris TaxID=2866214 RepID=UPI001CD12A70|nr:HAD family hydrolase [Devosia sp. CJK-A8-3]